MKVTGEIQEGEAKESQAEIPARLRNQIIIDNASPPCCIFTKFRPLLVMLHDQSHVETRVRSARTAGGLAQCLYKD